MLPHNAMLCADARMVGSAGGTGVTRYARALVAAQTALAADHWLLGDDTAFAARQSRGQQVARWLRALPPGGVRAGVAADGTRRLHAPDLFRLAQVYFDVHGRLMPVRAPGHGIMHWTFPVPLRLVGWRNLYTVHDVIPLTHPELSPIPQRRFRRLLERVEEAADAIVTVSDSARGEIVAALGCAEDMVVDCGQAIAPAAPVAAPLPEGLVAGGYFLVCGAIERRKNLLALLHAYRASGVALPIAFAGPEGWQGREVLDMIAVTPGAMRLGYLSDDGLRAVMAQARALLMPSLAEGFGLPAVEAMALGTPVLASDHGALAEVTGGAALAVDPADIAAMAGALRRLASDDALCRQLSGAGRQVAARHAPDRFRERLGRLYAGIVARDDGDAKRRASGKEFR
ncbi:glycosyltransferase family 1 protein [uncultured Sphingomonas sp.]|uniref:glycosyltransferase family 4 protein n=1 Tax=uncultured Sphingomonas sp. TaxID=158754 RepID=UPI0025DFC7E8|nr:glycosyltransferase family 1 protein [uncultured Sphingomonas sp.]